MRKLDYKIRLMYNRYTIKNRKETKMIPEINPKLKEALEWTYCIIIAVILALLVKYYIGIPTVVQQVSMNPTLYEGERLLLDRTVRTFHRELNRGDIVTFEAPSKIRVSSYEADFDYPVAKYENEPQGLWNRFAYYVLETTKESYIKRVIGLPGEHVKIENGKVYINGELLDEPYLADGVKTEATQGEVFLDIVVPEGTLFLMGDNRPQSTDSRSFGCVPIEKIESRVLIRFWPLNLFGTVD